LSRFNTYTANQNQWVWPEHHLLLRCNWGLVASTADGGWAHFGLDEANDCSAGVTLRSFVISPFMGDFAYRLNLAAAD
jgi:hypothetical protein